MDYHPIQGKVEILLAVSSYRNRDKLLLDGPPGRGNREWRMGNKEWGAR